MPSQVITLIAVSAVMFLVIGGLAFISHYYTLDGIKSKTVGDGQHGTARWATKQEIRQTYAHIPFEPELWRKGEHLPEKQGLILGCEGPKNHVTALVDTDDIHAMVTAASGAGKTAFFLYPNIEYALASGMSFLCTDTKGDLYRNYAGIAKDFYGYQIAVLDLRNPTRSDGNNLLHLINKYMDIYKANPNDLAAKAKAEKYSKILAKTLINTSGGDSAQYGQNAFFYRLFGVNAELLIDHAWGWEPCTIADVKAYKPENKSIVSGQVLQCPYPFDKARLVVREMADSLALDLVDKGLVTNQLVLTVGYDIENLAPTRGGAAYAGETTTDRYGRKIPKHAVGTENFSYTSSANDLLETITALYDRIVDKALLVRRLSISANRLLHEEKVPKQDEVEQLDLFTDYAAKEKQKAENAAEHARERKIQETILGIKKKFGKNAILKGLNLEDGATARERNQTIGGHQA